MHQRQGMRIFVVLPIGPRELQAAIAADRREMAVAVLIRSIGGLIEVPATATAQPRLVGAESEHPPAFIGVPLQLVNGGGGDQAAISAVLVFGDAGGRPAVEPFKRNAELLGGLYSGAESIVLREAPNKKG